MRRFGQAALVLVVIASASQNVLAQGRGGFGGGGGGGVSFLINQASVQEELKMTAEQKAKAPAEMEKMMEEMQNLQGLDRAERAPKMAEIGKMAEKSAATFLNPEQMKRVKQISLQQQSLQAFSNPEVADALKLTNEQKDKLKGIQDGVMEEMRGLFQGGGNRQEAMAKMPAINKAAMEKGSALLTAEQKDKWSELVGKPFTGEIVFRRRGQ